MPRKKRARSSGADDGQVHWQQTTREDGLFEARTRHFGPRRVLDLKGSFDLRCIYPPDWQKVSEFERYCRAQTLTSCFMDQLMGWGDELVWRMGEDRDLWSSFEKVIERLRATGNEEDAALASELSWSEETARRKARESSGPPKRGLLSIGTARFLSDLAATTGVPIDEIASRMFEPLDEEDIQATVSKDAEQQGDAGS
jgi:hypothetical protein